MAALAVEVPNDLKVLRSVRKRLGGTGVPAWLFPLIAWMKYEPSVLKFIDELKAAPRPHQAATSAWRERILHAAAATRAAHEAVDDERTNAWTG